jgi:two-component system alkaline phosphatase synthesis response regulator PhoP
MKKHILLVEDEQMLREAYDFLLGQQGYAVTAVCDGKEALDYLRSAKHKPSLILLDMLMPHMDGLQFLQAVDVKKEYPGTNVIVFSNLSNTTKIRELLDKGATKHVLKAELGPTELLELVEAEA